MTASDKSPSRNRNDALLQSALSEFERVRRNAQRFNEQIVWLRLPVIDELMALIRDSLGHHLVDEI